MRCFEKISYAQFAKDVVADPELYERYSLPARHTMYSAGYDFESLLDFTLLPNERKKIPTGIKFQAEPDEMLLLIVRSSLGFRSNIRLCNQVGVIESDYYNNEDNEGHMWIALQNEGDEPLIVKEGDRLIQGIFTKFLCVDQDQPRSMVRRGGMGSTDKEETYEKE